MTIQEPETSGSLHSDKLLIQLKMSFDRSKYRAASLSTVNNTVNETKAYDTYYGGKSDYAPFWKEREGVTIKRVLPAKNPGESPYVPMLTVMLQCEVDKKQDGKVVGKEIVRKKIFLATLHGKYPYDIVEEYIKRVYELAEQIQDKTEKDRFLAPITGYRMGGKNGKWVSGIRPNLEYVYYAYIEGKIYRDSLNKKQMEALNRESADLCAQNDTAAIDMFSDPNTGFPIQWSRGKDDNGKTVVTIKSLPLKMGQSWEDYYSQNAVPDKVLEELEGYPSLNELYVDSYGMRDFQLELDGIKRFDDSNQYKIFAQEDYLDMIEKLQAMIEQKAGVQGKDRNDADNDLPFENPSPQPEKKAPKAVARKTAPAKPAGPTAEEKLAVVNTEFVRQYGEGYEEIEVEGLELDELYALAVKKEDLGYDIPHIEGWDTPEPEPAPTPKKVVRKAAAPVQQPEPDPEPVEEEEKPAPAVQVPAEANSQSGMSAIERIRALRAQKQAAEAAKK